MGNNLNTELERLRAKLDQLQRFTECFVSHPYEGTLECGVKPCPYCRYQEMTAQRDRAYAERDAAVLQNSALISAMREALMRPENWREAINTALNDLDPAQKRNPVIHNGKNCPHCKQEEEERENFGPRE